MNHKLSETNWSSLEHAYGSAEDVPDFLEDLQSADADVRQEAYDALFGNIWHQGTVYSATSPAVPFLFELLDSPETEDKDSLVLLLACIAAGSGYYQVHQPVFEQWDLNVDKHENELRQEAADVAAVRAAISPKYETLLAQITGDDSEIRRLVAEAAMCYPEHSEKSVAALKQALEVEIDEAAREAIAEAISRLSVAK